MPPKKKRKVTKKAKKLWSERYRNMAQFAPAHPVEREPEEDTAETEGKEPSEEKIHGAG